MATTFDGVISYMQAVNRKAIIAQKRKHEMMSVNGLRGSILMQLARRGGHKSSQKLKPGKVDRYLQAVRDGMLRGELSKRKPPKIGTREESKKVSGAKSRSWCAACASTRKCGS